MLIFCDNKHVLTLHVGQGRKVPREAGGWGWGANFVLQVVKGGVILAGT